MAMHTFDTEIVKKVGFPAAVLYQNIVFWTEHNMRNRRHYHDGRWWTYNTRKAFTEQFDYMTEDQIRYALEKLVKAGLIKKGRFNKKGYDKTTWYSPDVSKDWTLGENPPMEVGKSPNGLGKVPQPIPDSKPDTKPDSPYGRAGALGASSLGSDLTSQPRPSKQTRGQRDYDEARQRALRAAARGPKEEAGEWF